MSEMPIFIFKPFMLVGNDWMVFCVSIFIVIAFFYQLAIVNAFCHWVWLALCRHLWRAVFVDDIDFIYYFNIFGIGRVVTRFAYAYCFSVSEYFSKIVIIPVRYGLKLGNYLFYMFQRKKEKTSDSFLRTRGNAFKWCRIQESNLHGCSHGVLSTTCLPFHQSGKERLHHQIILCCCKLFSDERLLDYTPMRALFVILINNCVLSL